MQAVFEVSVAKPSSWDPPYVEENLKNSEVPLQFKLLKDWYDGGEETYRYVCFGCRSAGGEIEDLFRTSSALEAEWPEGDGVPRRLAHEMYAHARQHEVLWRWAVNRIPTPKYDR